MKINRTTVLTLLLTLLLVAGSAVTPVAAELAGDGTELQVQNYNVQSVSYLGPVDCVNVGPQQHVVGVEISRGQEPNDIPTFISDMQAGGYYVGTVDINEGIPACVNKIVVLGLKNNFHITSPYTAADGTLLNNWVSQGKGLMILGDFSSYADDTQALTQAFGVTQGRNIISDSDNNDGGNTWWPVFGPDNFAAHPILSSVSGFEILAGSSLAPDSGTIVRTDDDGTANPGDAPVAIALSSGQGRVVIVGDTNWLTEYPLADGYHKQDNKKVAMNTLAWLDFEDQPGNSIPEFPTIVLPIAAMIGLMFLIYRRKGK